MLERLITEIQNMIGSHHPSSAQECNFGHFSYFKDVVHLSLLCSERTKFAKVS